MATPLEIYDYVKRGFNEGKQRATNRLLGQTLNATDPTQRQAYLRVLIDTDPQAGYALQQQFQKNAQAAQEKQQQTATELARAWLSTANITPQQRQNFYNTFITPQSQAAKLPIPEQYDPEAFDQEAKARIAMTQTGQSAQPYSLAPGARRYDANNQLVAEAPLQEKPHYDADRAGFVQLASDGTPVFKPVPGITPKPEPSQQLTPYQQAQLSLGQARLALDTETRRDAAETKKAALQAKAEQNQQAALARHHDAVESATTLIGAIDRLRNSPGYKGLGTPLGGLSAAFPYTDVRDAQAQLEVLKAQIALGVMSKLKALSPQGATGFGALSEKELAVIQNSIDSLSPGISHAKLEQSLNEIQKTMEKIKNTPPPYSVGYIIQRGGKQYRVVGGTPDDLYVEEVP
ncbi:MAG TPA: hypothetical protein ACQGQJ_07180 [Xylella fastidiosa subsp. multiplex]